jgi:HIRAN domain
LATWLRTHKNCELPAVSFLSEIVERIVVDMRVTTDEMKELHQAIEKTLPTDTRKSVVESRKTIEKAVKQKKKELESAERESANQAERQRKEQEREARRLERASQPDGFHSKIAGTSRCNDDGTDRQKLIRDYVQTGMQLIVKREPNNPYDDDAIALWVKAKSFAIFDTERQIGYLNADIACDLGPYLDKGGWVRVTVSEVTGGGSKYYGVNIFIEDGREYR